MNDVKVFFTVGPTQLYPTVPAHIEEALALNVSSISHRGSQFMDIYAHTMASVRKLLAVPEACEAFFLSSGTEAMERTIQNCVEKKSAHVVYGAFSKRWITTSKSLGKVIEDLTVPNGEVPDISKAAFSSDVELICVTQNETSTGGAIPPSALATLREKYPKALIGVDIVSSAPLVPLDWQTVDCVFFSVQKGFGLPAGLAVLFVSPRAFSKAAELSQRVSIGSYHSFLELKKYADKKQAPETPNVLDIYLLGKVTEDFLKIGLESLRTQARKRAKKVYEFLDSSSLFSPFVRNPNGRSLTTIAATVSGGSTRILEALKSKGLIIGSGYGVHKEEHIRIGNFPAHTDEDFDVLLAALEMLN